MGDKYMDNYQKFGLIAGQILAGFGFFIAGGIAGIVIISITSSTASLYGDILSALIAGYVGFFVGIAFDGYKFLKKNGRGAEFVKRLLQGLAGMAVGLAILWFIESSTSAEPMLIFSALALPLLGTIIGFNFRLNKGKSGR